MKKWLAMAIGILTIVSGTITAVVINFPPTLEQLWILNGLRLNGTANLWVLRIITLIMMAVTVGLWYLIVSKIEQSLRLWTISTLITLPVFLVMVLMHPLVALKIVLASAVAWGAIYFTGDKRIRWTLIVSLVTGTILFNTVLLGNKPAIFNKLSLKDAQTELTQRIQDEDSLLTKITVPIWWRRVAYNKYFFVYKQVVAESLPFFDLESLFFQEVHPMEQKSVVMFYWIEFYLFLLGIYFLVKGKNRPLKNLVTAGILMSWMNYIFSEGAIYLRLIYAIFPLSIVVAAGWNGLWQSLKQKYVLAKIIFPITAVIVLYAMQINYLDMRVRTQKWFDNRPLAFQFWFENLKKIDYSKYQRIQVTTMIGEAKAYCYFYLGDECNQDKYVFSGFDLSKEPPVCNSIYAGFAGEFTGPDFKNNIPENWKQLTEDKGYEFIANEKLLDNIADKYGNNIGLAIKK